MAVLPILELIRTSKLKDLLGAVDADHVPYAGGTELVPAIRLGLRRPEAVVDLKAVASLHSITVEVASQRLIIGATVTHKQLYSHPDVLEHLPVLAKAASQVGNPRVRSTGTIGGNLCFAEPRSDLGCILIALGASCKISSIHGTRDILIDELLVGPFETSLEPEEVVTSVSVPFEPAGMSYWKLQSYERPTLGVALIPTGDHWEFTVGAAIGKPQRVEIGIGDLDRVEQFLDANDFIDDMCGSADYKRSVLRSYLRDVLSGEQE